MSYGNSSKMISSRERLNYFKARSEIHNLEKQPTLQQSVV